MLIAGTSKKLRSGAVCALALRAQRAQTVCDRRPSSSGRPSPAKSRRASSPRGLQARRRPSAPSTARPIDSAGPAHLEDRRRGDDLRRHVPSIPVRADREGFTSPRPRRMGSTGASTSKGRPGRARGAAGRRLARARRVRGDERRDRRCRRVARAVPGPVSPAPPRIRALAARGHGCGGRAQAAR